MIDREYVDEILIPAITALPGVYHEYPGTVCAHWSDSIVVIATPNWDCYDPDEPDFLPLEAVDGQGEPIGDATGRAVEWTGNVIEDVATWASLVTEYVKNEIINEGERS